MPPEAVKYLQDVIHACARLEAFTRGKSFADYENNELLQSAVERQFTIVGEALMQAAKLDGSLSRSIPSLPQIVAFRNVLVHGYAVVQHRTVWGILENELAGLQQQVESLLKDAGMM